jgi:hypothetical protein
MHSSSDPWAARLAALKPPFVAPLSTRTATISRQKVEKNALYQNVWLWTPMTISIRCSLDETKYDCYM